MSTNQPWYTNAMSQWTRSYKQAAKGEVSILIKVLEGQGVEAGDVQYSLALQGQSKLWEHMHGSVRSYKSGLVPKIRIELSNASKFYSPQ